MFDGCETRCSFVLFLCLVYFVFVSFRIFSKTENFSCLIFKETVEAESKSDNEEDEDSEKFEERLQHICEHDHIDSKLGELLDEQNEVDPG